MQWRLIIKLLHFNVSWKYRSQQQQKNFCEVSKREINDGFVRSAADSRASSIPFSRIPSTKILLSNSCCTKSELSFYSHKIIVQQNKKKKTCFIIIALNFLIRFMFVCFFFYFRSCVIWVVMNKKSCDNREINETCIR